LKPNAEIQRRRHDPNSPAHRSGSLQLRFAGA